MANPAQAARLWQDLRSTQLIHKCEGYARYTLPHLFADPLQDASAVNSQTLVHDFQSAGGLLVNNLSSKLTQALFPPNVPFFKTQAGEDLLRQASSMGLSPTDVNNLLAKADRSATERLFLHSATHKLNRIIKLLIVTGNALLYRDPSGKMIVWSLRSFAVRRDADGEWRTIVLKQLFRYDALPVAIQNDLAAKKPGVGSKPDRMIELYTLIERAPGQVNERVTVKTEAEGVRCGPESSYPAHLSPWVLATWNLADGEHYGRGLVEDFTGDFAKLSLVSEQLGLYELEALSILNLVDESKGSVADDYKEADSGEFVRGSVDGVKSYERGDYNKIVAIRNSLGEVFQRLASAFMWTGNMRDAERVTAEEIRATAREAENTLGGVYSLLAEQLQVPLAYLCLSELDAGLTQGLVSKGMRPTIMTGIPALTRSITVQNLLAAVQEINAIIPLLAGVDQRVDPQKVVDMILNSRGVDTSLLFKSPEQLAEEAKAKSDAAAQTALDTDALLGAGTDVQEVTQALG